MIRAEREKLASCLGRVASAAGAAVTISHEPRTTRVECVFSEVSVSFDIDGALGGGILASWYGAKRPLAGGFWFDSVNERHRRKATQYGGDDISFGQKFGQACRAVASGRAFLERVSA